MNSVVVLQVRFGSSRLPGKALLSLGGMPAAVLAAKRAGNRGLPVRVATSAEPSDDVLATAFEQCGFAVIRGSLDDVMDRYVMATADLAEDDVIVRLTGDNVFPDGALIVEALAAFEKEQLGFLVTGIVGCGLPYGQSLEIFRVSSLRRANRETCDAWEREHVTPWIERHHGTRVLRPAAARAEFEGLRCTIDNLADYERVAAVFAELDDPVDAAWPTLCEVLQRQAASPQVPHVPAGNGRPESVLTVGTAQLGLEHYGQTNSLGRPSPRVAVNLLRTAVRHGVNSIDTARAYGEAEKLVGRAVKPWGEMIRVVTKLDHLADIPEDMPAGLVKRAVDASVFRSCCELGLATLPVLLLHVWSHRTARQGAVWARLRELQREGVIGDLGASVYTPAEAKEALADPDIRHLQLPFNIVDHRWQSAGIDSLARQRTDVTIHARSVLLQGILAADPRKWPRIAGVDAERIVTELEQETRRLGRASRTELCLAFVRGSSWIHSLVVGIETELQLEQLIAAFQSPALSPFECAEIAARLPRLPETLLNPALWPVSS